MLHKTYTIKPSSFHAAALRQCHTKALAVFSPVSSPEVTRFLESLSAPEGRSLSERILHNLGSDHVHKPQHLLVEGDKVKLVFNSGISEQYRFWAKVMGMTVEERLKIGIPSHIPMPVDLKNLSWCGGGAMVDFDREEVIAFLKPRAREPEPLLLTSGNINSARE